MVANGPICRSPHIRQVFQILKFIIFVILVQQTIFNVFVFLPVISSSVGYLVFVDTSDLSILADVEHFVLSEVQWDPTGRYLTAITMGNNKVPLFGFVII